MAINFSPSPSQNEVFIFDSSNTKRAGTYTSIQAAIDAASAGDAILVGPGTYNENLLINKSSITLLSVEGSESTIIVGQGNTALGTILLTSGLSNVQIGAVGHGFEVIGINNSSPGLESAAIYLQGDHNNHTIIGNKVVANGDAGLLSEFGGDVDDLLIEFNEFAGKTFDGSQPAGIGFMDQFTTQNVPRQLVTLGNGGGMSQLSSNITFRNNLISGVAGGISSDDNTSEQGNNLVTIDAQNSLIEANTFTGFTNRFATALRVRAPGTNVVDNVLDHRSGGSSRGIFVQNGTGTFSGNQLLGGPGNEVISSFTPGDDTLNGGEGNDLFVYNNGDPSNYTITGGPTSFTIVDNRVGSPNGTDTLIGIESLQFVNGPNNVIVLLPSLLPTFTSPDAVTFVENSTNVAYTVSANDPEGDPLTYSLGGTDEALFNIDSITGAITFKTPPNFENPQDDGNDNIYTITVSASDGTLTNSKPVTIQVLNVTERVTTPNRDSINTGAGNDFVTTTLDNLRQRDSINGGAGNDTLVLEGPGSNTPLKINLSNSSQVLVQPNFIGLPIPFLFFPVPWSRSSVKGFENVDASGFTGNLNLTGSNLSQTLKGGSGADRIFGLGGDDLMEGGLGADELTGGLGNDMVYLGNDSIRDKMYYNAGDGTDTVFQFNWANDQIIFSGIANIDVVPNGSNTELRVGDGNVGNPGFGTGNLLVSVIGVTGFDSTDISNGVISGATFSFS